MIIVAGEALIDLTPASCSGVPGFVPHAGGSPFNVAVGIGRLGVPVAFLGRMSHDPFGRLLRTQLAASGVDLSYVVDGTELTTVAFVHMVNGHPEYGFYAENSADRLLAATDLPELPAGAPLHLGSISLVLEPGATTLSDLLAREAGRRLITLDPNVRPSLITDRDAYLDRVAGWIAGSDLVKVSDADLAWLYPDVDPAVAAERWLAGGAALVIVTHGGSGAIAHTAGAAAVAVEAPVIEVADTVGAGDSFMAATLAWLAERGVADRAGLLALSAAELSELLTFAVQAAAITCSRPGADPPYRAELP